LRILISALTASAALGIAHTHAADMSRPVPAPVVAAPYNWTGLYAGLNVGYGWGQSTAPAVVLTDPGGAMGFAGIVAGGGFAVPNPAPSGFIGGGQVGYDRHLGVFGGGSWVGGIVTDFQGAGIQDRDRAFTGAAGTATTTSMSISNKLDYLGTVRGKLGIASGNWLFFGTGGLAYGHVKSSFSASANFPGGNVAISGRGNSWDAGWTAGAGINYGIGPWILGVEYLHYDLGKTDVTAIQTTNTIGGGPASGTVSQTTAGDLVRATASYRF